MEPKLAEISFFLQSVKKCGIHIGIAVESTAGEIMKFKFNYCSFKKKFWMAESFGKSGNCFRAAKNINNFPGIGSKDCQLPPPLTHKQIFQMSIVRKWENTKTNYYAYKSETSRIKQKQTKKINNNKKQVHVVPVPVLKSKKITCERKPNRSTHLRWPGAETPTGCNPLPCASRRCVRGQSALTRAMEMTHGFVDRPTNGSCRIIIVVFVVVVVFSHL